VVAGGAVVVLRNDARELVDLQAQWAAKVSSRASTPTNNMERKALPGSEGREKLKSFEQNLLPHAKIPVVVQALLRLAEDDGLSIRRGDYRLQADAGGGFVRYQMTLPVKGTAPAIHHFIQAALLDHSALALESVQFKRERIESSEIEARLQWVLLTALPGIDRSVYQAKTLRAEASR
jgi:hypothetical protein